jgi:hypothetical protein
MEESEVGLAFGLEETLWDLWPGNRQACTSPTCEYDKRMRGYGRRNGEASAVVGREAIIFGVG